MDIVQIIYVRVQVTSYPVYYNTAIQFPEQLNTTHYLNPTRTTAEARPYTLEPTQNHAAPSNASSVSPNSKLAVSVAHSPLLAVPQSARWLPVHAGPPHGPVIAPGVLSVLYEGDLMQLVWIVLLGASML